MTLFFSGCLCSFTMIICFKIYLLYFRITPYANKFHSGVFTVYIKHPEHLSSKCKLPNFFQVHEYTLPHVTYKKEYIDILNYLH